MKRKRIYILLLVSISLSCNNKETHLYTDYINQFKGSIRICENTSNGIYSEFESLLFENPAKVEPFYCLTRELKNNKRDIITIIDSILETKGIENDELNKHTRLNKQEIECISQKIDIYRNKTILLVKDSIKYPEILNKINTVLNTQKLVRVNAFKSEPVSAVELLACFYKLKSDIFLAENTILTYLLIQINTGCKSYTHVEAFVAPDSEILPVGFPYRARIFLAAIDTTASIRCEIEGISYEVISGKGLFKHKVSENSGIQKKMGNFILKSPYTGEIRKIPITIEYEVLESNKAD